MSRITYDISSENRRRIQLLQAFAKIDGEDATVQQIMDRAIERLFVYAYDSYMKKSGGCDLFTDAMEKLLPAGIERGPSDAVQNT